MNAPNTPAQNRPSDSAMRTLAFDKLDRYVKMGLANAGAVVGRILTTAPADYLETARGAIITTTAREVEDVKGSKILKTPPRVDMGLHAADGSDLALPLTEWSFGQLVERQGVPRAYAKDLRDGAAWEAELLQTILRKHMAHSPDRYLVRTVDGQVRGVLSDKYKRLDSRPMIDAFVGACQALGVVPVEGHATETQVAIRAIHPEPIEIVPGEWVVFGLHWRNSDFGNGSYSLDAFVKRLVCLNGMTAESTLRAVHVGSRLGDSIAYSQKTYDLDSATLASATGDAVRGVLSAEGMAKRADHLRLLNGKTVTFAEAVKATGRELTKAEGEAVRGHFEGDDATNMPSERTMWRFANALSWVANSTENPDRALDLQKAAGKLVAMPESK